MQRHPSVIGRTLVGFTTSLAFSRGGWSRSSFAVAVDIRRQLEPSLLNIQTLSDLA
jgi:hypothetical protein